MRCSCRSAGPDSDERAAVSSGGEISQRLNGPLAGPGIGIAENGQFFGVRLTHGHPRRAIDSRLPLLWARRARAHRANVAF